MLKIAFVRFAAGKGLTRPSRLLHGGNADPTAKKMVIDGLYKNLHIQIMDEAPIKTVVWVGPTRKELKAFPRPVQRAVGLALYAAQLGETPPDAKVLQGFGGAGVLELVEDHRGDTYRAVYTVRFATKIYVLHVFQKKSKRGTATPQKDIALIRARLSWAGRLYAGKVREG